MEGELGLLRVGMLGLRRKWRPQHAVLKGSTLHLSQAVGGPERLKLLPLAGAAINRKDISRPADAWRNLLVLVLPPLADRSRGIKKYTISAATAELQAAWMSALTTASQSPAERRIAAYSNGRRLSRSLSRFAAAAFRPLQLGISALSASERRPPSEVPAEAEQDPDADSVQCWALPTATSTQQFALPTADAYDDGHTAEADGAAVPAAVSCTGEPLMPGVATLSPIAGPTGFPDSSAGRSETASRSDGTAGAAAASAAAVAPSPPPPSVTTKVTYPQLQAQATPNCDEKPDRAPAAGQQSTVTQLIEQQGQYWEGAVKPPPTLQPVVTA